MEQLEEQIAHLTRIVDEMSEMIAKQDKEIRRMTMLVEKLARREAEREAAGMGGVVIGDETPPHY
ncbi:MAG: SlyX family protein [Pseudomonadota bacterium]